MICTSCLYRDVKNVRNLCFWLHPEDEEANKKSEETRSITNEGERDDYVSDRGRRRVQAFHTFILKKSMI